MVVALDLEDEAPKSETVDIVAALLEKDAARKKEMELKKQQEEAEANKRKELKAMSNDELKKLLVKKGQQAEKNKDTMVEALFAIHMQEEAAVAKKNKLKSLAIDTLNKLLLSRGLEIGKKDEMVESLLAYEVKVCEAARVYAAKFQEVLEKMKVELESKTGAELKDLCASKGLKAGVGKEENVERLLEE